jgi:hypothetical protein
MRKFLSINLLIACFALPSCSDGAGTLVTSTDGPEAPINDPDSGVFNPGNGGSNGGSSGGGNTAEPTGNGGSGASGGAGSEGGEQIDPGGGGGNGSSGANNGGSAGGGGSSVGQEGGGSSSQPVPEPGTLLLVGSGLAGVGASLLRRRRKREQTA